MINKDDWAFTTMTELADIRQHPILAYKKRDSLRLFVKQMYMLSLLKTLNWTLTILFFRTVWPALVQTAT